MKRTNFALLGAASAIALVGWQPVGTLVASAAAADPGDLAVLETALQLERFAIRAYGQAAGTNILVSPVLAVAQGFAADHSAHRDALIAAIKAGGGTPTDRVANIDVPKLVSQKDILEFAFEVEQKAASTYLSVISEFKDRRLAQAAGAILGVETTHVSTLAAALGQPRPYPSGFVV